MILSLSLEQDRWPNERKMMHNNGRRHHSATPIQPHVDGKGNQSLLEHQGCISNMLGLSLLPLFSFLALSGVPNPAFPPTRCKAGVVTGRQKSTQRARYDEQID